MAESFPGLDEKQIKRDLHGEQVGKGDTFRCDFCSTEIPVGEPVMYDIAKVHDMPNLEQLIPLPDAWLLDASRCPACEVGGIDPETDGWEEAVIMLTVNESNGHLSADMSDSEILDYSPGDQGEYPPPMLVEFLHRQGVSMSRWGYLRNFLEHTPFDMKLFPVFRSMIAEFDQKNLKKPPEE